ncbi:MAG: hypothetical protein AAF125_09560, partial [Chloroflexota bacterium]
MTTRAVARLLLLLTIVWLALVLVVTLLSARMPRGSQLAYLTDCNGWENIALADLRIGVARQVTCTPTGKAQLAWSPDGAWLAFYNNAAALFSLRVLNVDTGELIV